MATPQNADQLEAQLYENLAKWSFTKDQLLTKLKCSEDELRPFMVRGLRQGTIGKYIDANGANAFRWVNTDLPDPIEKPKTTKATRARGRAPKTHDKEKAFQSVDWSYARTPRAIYRSELTPMARLAYCALADVRQTDTFKISRSNLAKKMGVSEMTAWTALAELIAAGWIVKAVQRQGGHGANAYRFTDTVFEM